MVSQIRAIQSAAALLDSATAVFLERGFAGARVDEIARKAGVNKALIYYHFRSKQGIYQAVLRRLFQGVLEAMTALGESEPDPKKRLIAFYGGMARLFGERPALPHLMLREVLSGGERMDPETAETLKGILGFVRDTVEQGVRQGSIRPVHPLLVHFTSLAPLVLYFTTHTFRHRLLPVAAPEIGMPTPHELLQHLTYLIDRGLEPAAERARPERGEASKESRT